MHARGVLAALAVLAFGLGAPAAAAIAVPSDVNDFSFESFDGEYHLGLDDAGHATTRVVETIVARFPDFDQNRGIVRAIPLADDEVPLDVTMVSVTDGAGAAVPYERSDYAGFAEFALGTDEYVHGRVTYVLEYTLRNTIRHFPDSGDDEFYWDINGEGWAQSFDSVSASVFVPRELAASLTGNAACYGGSEGCELTRFGDGDVEFATRVGPVGAHSTLTVAIGFEGGTVVPGQAPRDSWVVTVVPKVLLAITGFLVAVAAFVRNAVWRDARGRGTIIAQFEPPEDSNLLLDANIVGRVSSALPALLVDFAVRGMIRVIDTEPGGAVGSNTRRFSIELVSADGATPQELRVLVILFGISLSPGKRVNPGSLSADIGASLYGLPASVATYTVKEGYRAEPKSVLPRVLARIALVTVLVFVPVWVWAIVNDVLDFAVVGPTIGAVILAIAMPIALGKPKRLTDKGAELRDYLLGMKQYLTIAEEDRIRVLQSPHGAQRIDVTDRDAVVKLNERLLGYAVLWGVEEEWVDQLRAAYPESTPAWLEADSFDASTFRSFASAATSSVRPIVTVSSSGGSSWSSSGSSSSFSGSSGGGFSGGGGGGGGGGGR